MINKEPIYQQLNHLLKELILNGDFRVGEKFLTERSICDKYDVSRATANKAISNLVSEGVLEFRKGVGTFIKAPPAAESIEPISSFTENVSKAGKKPASKVLVFEEVEASRIDSEIRNSLGISEREKLYVVERLRLADNEPMILEKRFIVAKYCPGLTEHSMEGSLYSLLENEYGIHLTGSDETIQATVISGREAKLLQIKEGLAGFRITAVGFIENNVPLWWEQTVHRPDAIEFRCQVRPHHTDRKLRERLLLDNRKPI